MLPITGDTGNYAKLQNTQRVASSKRRGPKRKISPEAGRGLELLGHAIEYLADELALECVTGQSDRASFHPQVGAIELLKMLNREVYLSCPVQLTLEERIHAWMRKLSAPRHSMNPVLLPVRQRTRW